MLYMIAMKIVLPTGANFSDDRIKDVLGTSVYQLCPDVTVSFPWFYSSDQEEQLLMDSVESKMAVSLCWKCSKAYGCSSSGPTVNKCSQFTPGPL